MDNKFSSFRQQALELFQAGLTAADPGHAVKSSLSVNGEQLSIRLNPLKPEPARSGIWSKVYLIAFGKAACNMMEAAQESLPESILSSRCIAVTNYENKLPVINTLVLGAEHPIPDHNGIAAAEIVAKLVKEADRDELVLFLISGGGSALLPYPMPPLTLDDKTKVTELLLKGGATINQINCVRKHLSAIKGGRLAEMAAPADSHALLLSDVIDDDTSVIASGPTVADPSTYQDAISILESLQLWNEIPPRAAEVLRQGRQGQIPETPKPDNALFREQNYTIIGSNAVSLKSVANQAKQLNYEVVIYSDHLQGEAREVAEQLALFGKQLSEQQANKPVAVLAGGETTVTVIGTGQGGRNQELALAFALAAERHDLKSNWVLLSGGTDGLDGPTDAAGGLIDPETVQRIKKTYPDPQPLLENNDAYRALNAASDLLITGATGTNVADILILLINLPV